MKINLSLMGFGIFALAGLLVGLTRPFQLDQQGHLVLMMIFITIGLWIFKPLAISYSIGGALFIASMLIIGISPAAIFSGFVGSAVWILIPALFFGFVLTKTGLGKRIAYFGLKKTRLTYPGLLFSWALVGLVLSMLTPSITVRVVLITPIALSCVNILNLPEGSKGRSLILITAWFMALLPGTAWLTGSLTGPILNGFFSAVPGLGPVSFSDWAMVSLLPVAIITVLTALAGYFVFRPSEPLSLSKDAFIEEYEKLGPVTREEKISAAVLVGAFMMFVTASLHHIPDPATCLIALFLLAAFGLINSREISTGINWDLVLFIGTAMGFAAVFKEAGIAEWIATIVVAALAPVAGDPWLFVYATLIAMFLWRFIDVAIFIPTMAILSAVLPQIEQAYGINPLVWIPMIAIAMNAFFLSYQNMFALVAEANMAGKGWKSSHFSRYGIIYFIAVMVAMLAAVPYWISIGMFS